MSSIPDDITRICTEAIAASGEEDINPDKVASFARISLYPHPLDPHIDYCVKQHLQQVARGLLRRQFGAVDEPERTLADDAQQAFQFEGLQDRYPIPQSSRSHPTYRLRQLMSDDDLLAIAARMKRISKTFDDHANALIAYVEHRKSDDEAA